MPLADVNGIKLFYEKSGSGYPVVFCHEFAGDYRSWDLQVGYFSRKYETITYCARGYYPSDVPETAEEYTQQQSVDDLKGLMKFLDIPKAHIVGLSMGGNVALNFGIANPHMASSLVIAGEKMKSTRDRSSPICFNSGNWPNINFTKFRMTIFLKCYSLFFRNFS